MKKILRNALKPPADRQSEVIQFRLTKRNIKKLGKYPNKAAKKKILEAIGD